MKIRRKTNRCLNCKTALDGTYNYCPRCGQENNDNNVGIKTLLGDFFNTYLAIDSRFGRSVIPFFFKPGYLTNQYIEGKRMSYAHPLRLYLIISIFYFFTVSMAAREIAKDEPVVQSKVEIGNLEKLDNIDLKKRQDLYLSLNKDQRKELDSLLEDGSYEQLAGFLIGLDSTKQHKVRRAIGDSLANALNLKQQLITKKANALTYGNPDDNIFELLAYVDEDKVNELDKEYDDISNESIYDSLRYNPEISGYRKSVLIQTIRIKRADEEQVSEYIIKNLPIMMLLLIPVFALILKLLYIRRDQFYIKHIVHALHLHSFAYLIYGIFIIVWLLLINNANYLTIWNVIGFTLVSVYSYLSFKNTYKQKWLKTFVKFNLVGFIYITVISVFFVAETVISLLLF